MNGVIASTRAELLRVRTWPAAWVTVGVWLTLTAMFGYVFDYVTYKTGGESFKDARATSAQLLAAVLPNGIPDVLAQGTPMFGGALMMVFGALMAGNGYGWGTWKTVFTQGPSRTSVLAGSLAAVTVVAAAMVAASLAMCVGISVTLALVESQDIVWPTAAELAKGAGAAFLVLEMWAVVGFLLGTLAKSPALSAGLGLVWALVIENLLRGVGALLGFVDAFAQVLPGTAAGSLVGSLTLDGGLVGADSAPGVLSVLSGTRATWTVVVYVAVLPLAAIALVRRRDIT